VFDSKMALWRSNTPLLIMKTPPPSPEALLPLMVEPPVTVTEEEVYAEMPPPSEKALLPLIVEPPVTVTGEEVYA